MNAPIGMYRLSFTVVLHCIIVPFSSTIGFPSLSVMLYNTSIYFILLSNNIGFLERVSGLVENFPYRLFCASLAVVRKPKSPVFSPFIFTAVHLCTQSLNKLTLVRNI